MLNTYNLLKHTELFVCAMCFLFFTTANAQTVNCPADTNLGSFNCTNINDIPGQPNNVEEAMAAPYNISIDGATSSTRVATEDSGTIFYCESDDRTVTRTVIVYEDADFSFTLDPGEEVGECTFTIETEPDTEPPVFEAPEPGIFSCDIDIDDLSVTGAVVELTDNNCPVNEISQFAFYADAIADGECPGTFIITRSWTAVDPCGNTSGTQTQRIELIDEAGPEFSPPEDVTIPCGSDPDDLSLTGEVTDATDACDNMSTIEANYVDVETMENTPCAGSTTIIRRWGAVDGCGNPNTEDQTIIIECPADCSNQDICVGDILEDPPPGECECVVVEEQVLGCTDDTACNFNPDANCDDESCMAVPTCNDDPCVGDVTTVGADGCSCELVEEQVLGCTDPEAANYNPDANCEDDSCVFPEFDLALIKVLASTGPFIPGGDVTFTITVFNQGDITAQNIEITDYIPTGLTLNDAAWADQGDGTATTTIAGPLASGEDSSVDITFTIPAGTANGSFENFAEISAAEDEDGNPGEDIDSTPDNDPDNDTNVDDVTDNTDGDEDDHDGAVFEIACVDGCTDPAACNYNAAATCDDDSCMAVPTCNDDPCIGDITVLSDDGCTCEISEPQVLGCTDVDAINYDPNANCDDGSCEAKVFDLALIKVLASAGPFTPGGDITFTITVFNQGNIVAQNIEITDYTPAGLTLNDAGWTDQGDGTATTTIAGPLAVGADASVDITFTIPANAGPGSFENFAEISSAEDEDGNPGEDVDSTPDNDPDNDTNVDDVTDNTDGDEDDHDGAVFEIACVNGCTDDTACNYDPAATCDDDSCMAVPTCNGDPCAGDVTALSLDGCTCEIAKPQVLGCTDTSACNYNPDANCNDGSCMSVPICNDDPCIGTVTTLSADGCSCERVANQVLGCMDSSACNYNPDANCDDGSCQPVQTCNDNPCRGDITKLEGCDCVVVEPQVLGCNDPLAENYDANANCNNGSCTYSSPCPPKMRVCTAPQTPIEICLPCILSGELEAEVTEVDALFDQCEIDGLDDENVACFTYTPLPLAESPSQVEVTYCKPSTGQCWTMLVIVDIDPTCGDGPTACPSQLNLCTTPTIDFLTAAPLEICIPCIVDGSYGAEITDVESLFYCAIDGLEDSNPACFTYLPVPLMELYSPEQLTVTYCIPGTDDCKTTVINIDITDDCGDDPDPCNVDGGTISGGPFNFCIDDGTPDYATGVTLSGNSGSTSQWVITDSQGNILGLPGALGDVNFDGAGSGTCLIWSITYQASITGLAEGANANDLGGCFDLSNSITVNRNECDDMTDISGCTDANACNYNPAATVDDGSCAELDCAGACGGSANSGTPCTDSNGNASTYTSDCSCPDVVLEIAGCTDANACNYDSTATVDDGTCAELDCAGVCGGSATPGSSCTDSNGNASTYASDCSCPDAVAACAASPATISGGPFSFCVGDGTADFVSGITVSGGTGSNNAWVITDEDLNILGLPAMPGVVDFDGAGTGVCLIWYVNYDDLEGAAVGANAADLSGCFVLSNSIRVERNDCTPTCSATAAAISGGPFSFCVGDGTADYVSGITVSGGTGTDAAWVITDEDLNILGLPSMPGVVDFDGAGTGVCLIWYVTFDDLQGAEVGANAGDLAGCYALSNSIRVTRETCATPPAECSEMLQLCSPAFTQANQDPSVEICIPCIIDGTFAGTIVDVDSKFECGIDGLDDDKPGCFTYKPLPLLQNYSPDITTVEYCDANNNCNVVQIIIDILEEGCEGGLAAITTIINEVSVIQPVDLLEEELLIEGIDPSEKSSDLAENPHIFPVPSSGLIYVSINDEMKGADMKIYNTNGQLLHKEVADDDTKSKVYIFDIRNFESGIYYLVAEKGDQIQTSQFIKQ